jgi:hypothetical protein
MKIKELFEDYGIEYTPGPAKNVKSGWVGIQCPFCNDHSNHLGYDLDEEHGEIFNCWRGECGVHKADETISRLLNVSVGQARHIINQYRGGKSETEKKQVEVGQKPFSFPSGTDNMKKQHKIYLEGRGFDPEYLEAAWNLKGTGPMSMIEGSPFKQRILAPIYWAGQVVSFQTRDIKDKDNMRYKTCPRQYESVHHKHIIYMNKRRKPGGVGFGAEGIFDVWRLGFDSFGTFGTKYTPRQIREIASMFDRVFLLFDPEYEAQQAAEKLAGELRFRKIKTQVIDLLTDPADMQQDDADYLIRTLKHRKL